MDKNLNVPDPSDELQTATEEQEKILCDVCGEEYETPLHAELVSSDHSDEYSACPRCLTKVEDKHQKKIETVDEDVEKEETEELQIEKEIQPPKTEDPAACPQYLGYLRKRPKNSPIPDSCFVCSKMIDCTL